MQLAMSADSGASTFTGLALCMELAAWARLRVAC